MIKVFLFVDESMGRRALNLLINEKIELIGIFSEKKSKDYDFYKSKSKVLNFKLFYDLNKQYKKIKEHLSNHNVDILLNIFSYSFIPEEFLNLAKIGAFNLHPGKLPQYAGLNPVSWTLFNGEKKQHVTLHWMTNKIDSGPIVYSKSFAINNKDTAINVMIKSMNIGEKLIIKFIKKIINSSKKIKKIYQNLKNRNYYKNIIPNSGYINWSNKSNEIFNFVRAFDYKPYDSNWLEPKVIYKKKIFNIIKIKKIKIKCKLGPGIIFFNKEGSMQVSTLDNWIIILKIKYKNKYINQIKYFKIKDKFQIINDPSK